MGMGVYRNQKCNCGSGKKYKNCHMDNDIELVELYKWKDPKTGDVYCTIGREAFKEGDKVDWIWYNKMRLPVCLEHKKTYEEAQRMVAMEQSKKEGMAGGGKEETRGHKKEKSRRARETGETILKHE